MQTGNDLLNTRYQTHDEHCKHRDSGSVYWQSYVLVIAIHFTISLSLTNITLDDNI